MRLVVLTDWTRTYDPALRVQAGQRVSPGRRDAEWPGWVWCTPESGPSGWLPDHLLDSSGTVRADYDTRELTVTRGDLLTQVDADSGWRLCRTAEGETGWVPESHARPCPDAEVFICQSLDGFIAEPDGGIDWLMSFPQDPEQGGYPDFIARIDALIMGRATYDTVAAFPDWPYSLPVILLSRHAGDAPRAAVRAATLPEAVALAAERGWSRLYVEGGETIRSAVALGIISRITITTAPLLLGAGRPLFGGTRLPLRLIATKALAHGFTQSVYEP